MFRWYREATVCYAYLTDVTEVSQIENSRWFTRGWTLQELVAPATVRFYTLDWRYLGSKISLQSDIRRITGIYAKILTTGELDSVSIARRMSWAAKRQTTRIEDRAYSLMGIFDVNMPLLYGEGKKAFARLQEAIMKTSDDQSLFAWGLPENVKTMQQYLDTYDNPPITEWRGLFADSPSEFTHCERIHTLEDVQSVVPPIVSNNGVRIELQLTQPGQTNVQFAAIYCTIHGRYKHYLGVPILPWGERWVARCGELVTIPVADLVTLKSDKPLCQPTVLLVKAPRSRPQFRPVEKSISLAHFANKDKNPYVLVDVDCSPHTSYSPESTILTLSEDEDTVHAVLYFTCVEHDHYKLLERLGVQSSRTHIYNVSSDEAHYEHSFSYEALIEGVHATYSATYPPFALLVGGRINNPWVKAVVVLEDKDTDASFKALHTVDARLIQSCTTRRHLSSLLGRNASPLRGHRSDEDRQLIMYYGYRHSSQFVRELPPARKKSLQVDARIKVVSKDLVQRELALMVQFTEVNGELTERKLDLPEWWTIQK
jgi:hypothetical protein